MRTDVEPEGAPAEPTVHRVDRVTIHSVDQYEAATRRVQELAGCQKGSPEEAELQALTDAVMEWDKTHDDATAWK